MEKSKFDEFIGRTVPRWTVLVPLAVAFAAGPLNFSGWEWCRWGGSAACRASVNAVAALAFAFPFGVVYGGLLMVVSPAVNLAIRAALGLGVGYICQRWLPPRITVGLYLTLFVFWVMASILNFSLAMFIFRLTIMPR